MPISRVRSVMVVYIERKITRNPMMTATETRTVINARNAGRLLELIIDMYSRIGTIWYPGSSFMNWVLTSSV